MSLQEILELVDVGIWTMGIVLSAAIVAWKYETSGIGPAVVTFLILVGAVLILGVTGSRATASVASLVEGEGDT